MGKTKELHQDIREVYYLTMDKEFYENNYEILKPPNTEIKRVNVIGENHDEDETHKKLLKKYLKAQKELRDYEYNKRHNFKKNGYAKSN